MNRPPGNEFRRPDEAAAAMKSQKTSLIRDVMISPRYWDVPIRVRLDRYLAFGCQIDTALDELISRFEPRGGMGGFALRRQSASKQRDKT